MANETGGAFVESTNDLAPGMARIAADLRQYYLLGYTPTKAADDKYRTIDVKVKGEGRTLLARKGYKASRESAPAVVRPAEVPALLLLDAPTHADAIPLLVATLRMPEPDARGQDGPRRQRTARRGDVRATRTVLTAEWTPHGARPRREPEGTTSFTTPPRPTTSLHGRGRWMQLAASCSSPRPPSLRQPLSVAIVAFDALGQRGSVRTKTLNAPAETSDNLRVGDLVVATQMRPRQPASAEEHDKRHPLW